jgi:hypothetical protein
MGLSPLGKALQAAAAVASGCHVAAADGFDHTTPVAASAGIVVWSHRHAGVAGNGGAASAPPVVLTNAPVLRWNSSVTVDTARGPAAVLAYRVNVTAASSGTWSSGDVRINVLPTWIGLAVYEGPPLVPSSVYYWTAEEQLIVRGDGTVPSVDDGAVAVTGNNNTAATAAGWQTVGSGWFSTLAGLISARDEAAAAMRSPNVSALWNGSWHSVLDRAAPSGFLPTSVSGGCTRRLSVHGRVALLLRGVVVRWRACRCSCAAVAATTAVAVAALHLSSEARGYADSLCT